MGKKSAPDPPDYGPISEVSREQVEMQERVAMEQLAWSREQWASQKDILDQIIGQQLPMMAEQWEKAKEDRARYERLYQPLEEEYLQRAREWDTPERRQQEAAKAQAEVTSQFEAQRQNALQRLESYGVDPSQTRNAALDLGVRLEEAKAKAGAATEARNRIEREGMGMLGESINVGRGLPSQGLQYAASAGDAASRAAGASAGWQGAASAMGGPTAWMQGGQNAVGNWANALGSQYNAQLAAKQYDWMTSPLNTGLSIAGAASNFFKFNDGGEAVAIPMQGGAEVRGPGGPTDDAIPARLSDGEYVIPSDVVRRKGTEFFDKLIDKTKEDQMKRMQNAQVTREALAIPPPSVTR